MAQKSRPKAEERQQELPQAYSLQIPMRTTQTATTQTTTTPQRSIREIPNGFEITLGGTTIQVTLEVTPNRQMINLTIPINMPTTSPPSTAPRRQH